MKILLQNANKTLAVGEIEDPIEFNKVVKIDASILKDLIKMMAPFEPWEYEVGVVGIDTLGFRPVSSEKNVSPNTIFLLATLADAKDPEKTAEDAVIVDPGQTEIIQYLPLENDNQAACPYPDIFCANRDDLICIKTPDIICPGEPGGATS